MFEGKFLARGTHVLSLTLVGVLTVVGILGLPATGIAQGPPENLPGKGPVALEGELDVLYEDDEENGIARLVHFLKTDDNRRVPLKFQGDFVPDLPTGSRVHVRGDLAEGAVTTTAGAVSTLAVSASRTDGSAGRSS